MIVLPELRVRSELMKTLARLTSSARAPGKRGSPEVPPELSMFKVSGTPFSRVTRAVLPTRSSLVRTRPSKSAFSGQLICLTIEASIVRPASTETARTGTLRVG